jgi:hypothetical protein
MALINLSSHRDLARSRMGSQPTSQLHLLLPADAHEALGTLPEIPGEGKMQSSSTSRLAAKFNLVVHEPTVI